MKPIVHGIAGSVAMLTVATFWMSTVISEAFFDHAAVALVKQCVVYGLALLITAMAATGASGFALSRHRRGRIVDSKKKRMPLIVANGLLIMLPCALFLSAKAQAGEFDTLFHVVQAIELAMGALQLTLLGMSFRDGMRLAGKLKLKAQ
ncbi:hypothetical protein [Cupriavidus sp. PET2-C1]